MIFYDSEASGQSGTYNVVQTTVAVYVKGDEDHITIS